MQVLGETVDEAALTQILLSVLQAESAAAATDDAKAEAQAQSSSGAPVGEVEAAARFVMKRYGKTAQRVAEQALKEVGSILSYINVQAQGLQSMLAAHKGSFKVGNSTSGACG